MKNCESRKISKIGNNNNVKHAYKSVSCGQKFISFDIFIILFLFLEKNIQRVPPIPPKFLACKQPRSPLGNYGCSTLEREIIANIMEMYTSDVLYFVCLEWTVQCIRVRHISTPTQTFCDLQRKKILFKDSKNTPRIKLLKLLAAFALLIPGLRTRNRLTLRISFDSTLNPWSIKSSVRRNVSINSLEL